MKKTKKEQQQERVALVSAFCKHFRSEYLGIGLKEFAEKADLSPKTVNSFEAGRANNISHLYEYYEQANEEEKQVFINNVFKLGEGV